MFHYFGYGSNLSLAALRAKGVTPRASTRGALRGWRLAFDVEHWFRHEGAVGNIHPTGRAEDSVLGVVHACDDAALARLDAMEAYGVGYDRVEVDVETEAGPVRALAYVGLPDHLDPAGRPTRRYLAILVAGAEEAGLDPEYVARLRAAPLHPEPDYPPFAPPPGEHPVFDRAALARHPKHTAMLDAVFDMSGARWQLEPLWDLVGGRSSTLFHLHRHDASAGTETLADALAGRIPDACRRYLDAYTHEYAREFRYAGRFDPG